MYICKRDKNDMTDEKMQEIAKLIRNETGCGLMEAKTAFEKFLYALKHHPPIIMDNPQKLKIMWEANEDN